MENLKYGQPVSYHGFKCVFLGICQGANYRYANLHYRFTNRRMVYNSANGFNVPEDKWSEIKL